MHVTFDSLKTFYNILVQKLKNHRGNWNQNDPTADDYIKNRPFYSEGVKETTIMDMVVNFDNSSSNMGSSGPTVYQTMIDDYSVKSFKIGETYTVIWDGQTYKCVAQDISGIGAIGNASLIGYMGSAGYEDSGEPFLIGAEQGYGYIVFGIEDGSHTMVVKTITEVVHKLDKKFVDMPDDIVTGEELEEILDTVDAHIYDINNPHNVTAGQIGAAPMNHASANMTYGLGNSDRYGHVKLSDSTNSTDSAGAGVAATPKAVSEAYTLAYNHANNKSNPHGITISQIGAASENHTHSYLRYLNATAKMPISKDWTSIAYGDGKFVAVADNTYDYHIVYSLDGITWTETTWSNSFAPRSVTYGNGKFVIVGARKAAYSYDGITWTDTALTDNVNATSVTYGDGKFVAVSVIQNQQYAAYSSDGITWSETTLPISVDWATVAYGDGKFVVVEQHGNKAAYSLDGIVWIETTLPNDFSAIDVAYGGDKFVAISHIGIHAYSSDGIAWTKTDDTVNSVLANCVTYGDDKFVAIDRYEGYYSLDGITWSETTLPIPGYFSCVTYGNGKFVAITNNDINNNDSNIVIYSEDGINWKREYTGVMQDGISIDLESIGLATKTYVTEAVATKADSDHTHDYNDLENKTHYIDKELNLDKSGQYTVTKQIYVEFGYPDVIVCTCDGVEYTLNKKWVGGTGYWGYDEFQAGTSPVYFESNATGDAQSINVVDDGKAHEVVYSTYYATNVYVPLDEHFIPDTIARVSDIAAPRNELILNSSTEGSTKQFKITIDDTGTLTVSEIV